MNTPKKKNYHFNSTRLKKILKISIKVLQIIFMYFCHVIVPQNSYLEKNLDPCIDFLVLIATHVIMFAVSLKITGRPLRLLTFKI